MSIRNIDAGRGLSGNQSRNFASGGADCIGIVQGADFRCHLGGDFPVRGSSRLDMKLDAVFTPGDRNITLLAGRDWNFATDKYFGFFATQGRNIRPGEYFCLSALY